MFNFGTGLFMTFFGIFYFYSWAIIYTAKTSMAVLQFCVQINLTFNFHRKILTHKFRISLSGHSNLFIQRCLWPVACPWLVYSKNRTILLIASIDCGCRRHALRRWCRSWNTKRISQIHTPDSANISHWRANNFDNYNITKR